MAQITAVTVAICQVSDMDRAVAFYRDVLGMAPRHTTPYWSDLTVGNFRIGLHPPFEGSEPPFATPGKGWILGMQVDDIKELRAKLEAAGAPIPNDYHDVPGGVVLDFQDPEGNNLQAMQLGISSKDLS